MWKPEEPSSVAVKTKKHCSRFRLEFTEVAGKVTRNGIRLPWFEWL